MTSTGPAAVIVLAAGEGTRMRSTTPKVLHTLAGRSMLGHVLAAARAVDPERVAVVVRHGRDRVAEHALAVDPGVLVADQDEVPGTGRAVQCALDALDATAPLVGPVVVTAGDTPLLDGGTLAELLAAHTADGNGVTVLTLVPEDPTGYGRVVRDADGQVARIVEHADADEAERAVREVNAAIYVFDAAVLRDGLARVGSANAQGEVYLTDVIGHARAAGHAVHALISEDPLVAAGVNDRVQLAELAAELNRRLVEDWMRAGVTVVDPATTWLDVDVELARDVTLLPGTQLHGSTRVGEGATVGPDTTLTDVEVGAGATVVRTHGSAAVLGAGATVGPFAYLRPGTVLGAGGKIGTFVETKNVEIGAGTKVPHLTYVGDATIGEHSNIGASSVFVNYDGVRKHRTTIGSHVRTGSDNMFVAPVEVGDGAYTGAGTVVRHDVPPGALSVSAGPQRVIEGWVLRSRAGTASAEAAARALAARAGLPDDPSSPAPDPVVAAHPDPTPHERTPEGPTR